MASLRKPVLVTGSHRSGTTWTGKTLAEAPRTKYLHEPFHLETPIPTEGLFDQWFQHICEENAHRYQDELTALLTRRWSLRRELADAKTAKGVLRALRGRGTVWNRNERHDTPIVKDPIAIFSAAWLAETFDMNVVVLIRHPAAFCSSLKLKNWTHDFSHFLNQPTLMSRRLKKFEGEIREHAVDEKDIISQAILLWNCVHHTIAAYQDERPEWLFVKHETLSSDPVDQFRKMFARLGLEFTPKVESSIRERSGSHNPTEQQSGSNEFVRNSKENISNWKSRLTMEEIRRIRAGTSEYSELFYAESDW